jgi:hypothetical protein
MAVPSIFVAAMVCDDDENDRETPGAERERCRRKG